MKCELTELKQKLGESEGESESILSVIRSNQSSFDMSMKPASFMSSSQRSDEDESIKEWRMQLKMKKKDIIYHSQAIKIFPQFKIHTNFKERFFSEIENRIFAFHNQQMIEYVLTHERDETEKFNSMIELSKNNMERVFQDFKYSLYKMTRKLINRHYLAYDDMNHKEKAEEILQQSRRKSLIASHNIAFFEGG